MKQITSIHNGFDDDEDVTYLIMPDTVSYREEHYEVQRRIPRGDNRFKEKWVRIVSSDDGRNESIDKCIVLAENNKYKDYRVVLVSETTIMERKGLPL